MPGEITLRREVIRGRVVVVIGSVVLVFGRCVVTIVSVIMSTTTVMSTEIPLVLLMVVMMMGWWRSVETSIARSLRRLRRVLEAPIAGRRRLVTSFAGRLRVVAFAGRVGDRAALARRLRRVDAGCLRGVHARCLRRVLTRCLGRVLAWSLWRHTVRRVVVPYIRRDRRLRRDAIRGVVVPNVRSNGRLGCNTVRRVVIPDVGRDRRLWRYAIRREVLDIRRDGRLRRDAIRRETCTCRAGGVDTARSEIPRRAWRELAAFWCEIAPLTRCRVGVVHLTETVDLWGEASRCRESRRSGRISGRRTTGCSVWIRERLLHQFIRLVRGNEVRRS